MSLFVFLAWLILVWGAGVLAFPLSRRVFADVLPDAGLAVGRVLFLVAWTMLAFWLGYAGVPVAWSAWLYGALALLGGFLWWRDWADLGEVLRSNWRAIRAVEAVFLVAFLGFFVLRGFWSDTNNTHGEKGMDSALIASLARAQTLPPPNTYAAGAQLRSYYYFGHLQTALLTRASGTSVRWSYNLMCATVPALCWSALFALGAGLTGRLKGGAFVTLAVLAGGSLQPIFQWLNPQPHAQTEFLRLDAFGISRVIPYTINEFPWFTAIHGDLHGHFYSFPLQVALMALAWALYHAKRAGAAGLAALGLGALIVTNTWDFPIYALLIGLAMVSARGPVNASAAPALTLSAPPNWKKWAGHSALGVGVALGALLLTVPYWSNLTNGASPPQPLRQPSTPLAQWLLMWGPITLGWWLFAAMVLFRSSKLIGMTLGVIAILVLGMAGILGWLVLSPLVLLVVIASVVLAGVGAGRTRGTERFLCLLGLAGLLTLVWSETMWSGFMGSASQIGPEDWKRQDTVFKFGLQAWFLWGTASAAGVWVALVVGPRWLRPSLAAVAAPLLAVMLAGNAAYTLLRVGFPHSQEWGNSPVKRDFRFDGWDAWAHMAPPEQAAADWLQNHARPGQNIVEASLTEGGDYNGSARYAHATGLPTLVGPENHTYQWSPANLPPGHGEAGRAAKKAGEKREVKRRQANTRAIYASSTKPAERARLLQTLRHQLHHLGRSGTPRLRPGHAARLGTGGAVGRARRRPSRADLSRAMRRMCWQREHRLTSANYPAVAIVRFTTGPEAGKKGRGEEFLGEDKGFQS